MKKNVGKIDMAIRIILGIGIIGAGIYYQNWLGLIGIIPLATALMGWCPLYLLFGMTTCSRKADA